jgi:hypothetical protein
MAAAHSGPTHHALRLGSAGRVALQHISKKQNGLRTNYRLADLPQGMMAVS